MPDELKSLFTQRKPCMCCHFRAPRLHTAQFYPEKVWSQTQELDMVLTV